MPNLDRTDHPSPCPSEGIWLSWTLPAGDPAVGRPLGQVLRRRISLRLLRRLKATGGLRVNGEPRHTDYLCRAGDLIQLIGGPNPELTPSAAPDRLPVEPEPLPLSIVYEDEWLLAVNKPAGQLTHPVRHERHGTVANAVAAHWAGQTAVHPVLRLDRQTSGLLLFAANPLVHERMQAQQQQGDLQKTYLAIVERILPGGPMPTAGRIDWPLAPVPGHRNRHQIIPRVNPGSPAVDRTDSDSSRSGLSAGRPASTRYRCLRPLAAAAVGGPPRALLLIEPLTGRTHQIRLHLAAYGWPIEGDPVYGSGYPAARMALHAWRLAFRHPFTGRWVDLEASPPPEWPVVSATGARVASAAPPAGPVTPPGWACR